MTNTEAIRRIQQKIDWLTGRMADGVQSERANFYAALDRDAFVAAVNALRYADAMAEYEQSQTTT